MTKIISLGSIIVHLIQLEQYSDLDYIISLAIRIEKQPKAKKSSY